MTFYVLICLECGDGDLPMPFETAEARGKWAAAHTKGTGHDRWFVTDQDGLDVLSRAANIAYTAAPTVTTIYPRYRPL